MANEPYKCSIDDVDLSTYWVDMQGINPTGPGAVGTAQIELEQEAGGLSINPMQTVKLWRAFDTLGNGIKARGRLFQGLIINRYTKQSAGYKVWQLDCVDLNALLSLIRVDLNAQLPIIPAGLSFPQWVAQAISRAQLNGFGSVAIPISTAGVADLLPGQTMPAFGGFSGLTLGEILTWGCIEATRLNPSLAPRFYIGSEGTSGSGAVFGGPVAYIYNAAASPGAYLYTLSDAPVGAEKIKYGDVGRQVSADSLAQRKQSAYGRDEAITILTYADAVSQAAYPNKYQSHGLPGGTGYWMGEPIEDRDSRDTPTAQATLQNNVLAVSRLIETYDVETDQPTLPGDYVGVKDSFEYAGTTGYYVAAVAVGVGKEDIEPMYKLQLGSRRLELGDDVVAASQLGLPREGLAIPLAPTTLTLGTLTWDELGQYWLMPLSWVASLTPNVARQALLHTGATRDQSVATFEATVQSYTLPWVANAPYTLSLRAYNAANKASPPSNYLTGTTPAKPAVAAPTGLTLDRMVYNPVTGLVDCYLSWVASTSPGVAYYEVQWMEGTTMNARQVGKVLTWVLSVAALTVISALSVRAVTVAERQSSYSSPALAFQALVQPLGETAPPNGDYEVADANNSAVPAKWTFTTANGASWGWASGAGNACSGARSISMTKTSTAGSEVIATSERFPLVNLPSVFEIAHKSSVGGAVEVQVLFYNAAGTLLNPSPGWLGLGTSTTWATVTIDPSASLLQPVAGAAQAEIKIRVYNNSGAAGYTVWVDRVKYYPQLTTEQVKDDAITNAKLAPNAVGSTEVADNAIIAAKLATVAGLTAGTYNEASVTVDNKGRVTAIANRPMPGSLYTMFTAFCPGQAGHFTTTSATAVQVPGSSVAITAPAGRSIIVAIEYQAAGDLGAGTDAYLEVAVVSGTGYTGFGSSGFYAQGGSPAFNGRAKANLTINAGQTVTLGLFARRTAGANNVRVFNIGPLHNPSYHYVAYYGS